MRLTFDEVVAKVLSKLRKAGMRARFQLVLYKNIGSGELVATGKQIIIDGLGIVEIYEEDGKVYWRETLNDLDDVISDRCYKVQRDARELLAPFLSHMEEKGLIDLTKVKKKPISGRKYYKYGVRKYWRR